MSDQRSQYLKAGGSRWGCLGCLGVLALPVVIFVIWWVVQMLTGSTSANPNGSEAKSDSCESSMEAAAVATSESDAERNLRTSLGVCKNVSTWEAALRQFPGAMGLNSADDVDPKFDLAGICAKYGSEPVCVDAVARGLDTYW